MTHLEQAIQDAKSAGWDDSNFAFVSDTKHDDTWLVNDWQYDSKIFIDPNFWQALGKARGWEKWYVPYKRSMPEMTEWQTNCGMFSAYQEFIKK